MTTRLRKPTAARQTMPLLSGLDESSDPAPVYQLTHDDVQVLADRLFSRGVSAIATYSSREKADLIAASRTMRALLRHYEFATGRQLQTVILVPEVL